MTKSSQAFRGKLMVITGGGSGIGRETALAFARRGAEVVLSDINLDAAKQTAAMIGEAGGTAHAYQLDVADEAAMHAHAEEVAERHGVPDIRINNAGIGQAGAFLQTPSKSFTRVMDINFYGVVNGCRAFGAKMVERGSGGHIVNLASMAAYSPLQSFSAYSTSKAAVFMFSDCLRAESARSGIGVSTICPGIVQARAVASNFGGGGRLPARRVWRNFFDSATGKRKGRRVGRPRTKSRKDHRQSFRLTRSGFSVRPPPRSFSPPGGRRDETPPTKVGGTAKAVPVEPA